MSGVSGTSTSSSAATPGTDLAPITFPGIASGIDYNSIIAKLTSLTLAPNTQYNSQITQINAKNAELIKINGLLASVQSSLNALSDPATFNSFVGTTNDPLDATVSQIAGGNPTPGTYTVSSTRVATATQVLGGANAGASVNPNLALACAGTAVIPTNGTTGSGIITVNGVAVNYDVGTQSLNTIVADIYTAVHAVDAGFTISAGLNGVVTIESTDEPIAIGAPGDQGNLQTVLKLDIAQINNSGPPYSVTSAGAIGGVNLGSTFLSAGNAGFATVVTSGQFTINGVGFTVNAATDNVTSVLAKINSSTAGVVAAYNLTNDTFSITNSATGAQSVVLGKTGDTSNFLSAAELTPSTGATSDIGTKAYVAVLTTSGALQTTYSNSDAVAGAIPGMAINLTGTTSTPFTVTVQQNASLAIGAITSFVSVYNAALTEIAIATAPPVVQQTASTSTSTTSTSSLLSQGGVLYNDPTIQNITDTLTDLVSGLTQNGSPTYNSLASIGLDLDSSHLVYASNTDAQGSTVDSTTTGPITTTSVDGTDGQFTPLDVTKFTAAFAANPSAVAALFVSTSVTSTAGLTNQLGSFLTGVTGTPTSLVTGLVGSIPLVSLLESDEEAGTAEISALSQSIKNVTAQANAQADRLRAQATASEALVAKYQAEQTYANQLSAANSSS